MIHLARKGSDIYTMSINEHEWLQLMRFPGSCRRLPRSASPLDPLDGPVYPNSCLCFPRAITPLDPPDDAVFRWRVSLSLTLFASEVWARLVIAVPLSTGLSPLFFEPEPSPTVEDVRMLEFRRSCRGRPPVPTSVTDARLDPEGWRGAAWST